jgi:hypothetical protein
MKAHTINNKTKTLFITLQQLAKVLVRFFEFSWGNSYRNTNILDPFGPNNIKALCSLITDDTAVIPA